MSEIDLAEKFPDMTPVRKSPSLFTLNGFGLTAYGRRDVDRETGTYVKTHYFCCLFIPVLALGSYRVADAENGGWYFIGKVPLSGMAKAWNYAILGFIAFSFATGYWASHTSSPDYKAARKMAEADTAREAGDLDTAIKRLSEVATVRNTHRDDAAKQLGELVTADALAKLTPAKRLALVNTCVALHKRLARRSPFHGLNGTVARLFDTLPPREAMALLDATAHLSADPQSVPAQRLALLKRWVEQDPTPEAASRLAVIYETQNQHDAAIAVLMPHAAKLGTTEGARILGQALARKGDVQRAFQLLNPYCKAHLAAYHAAEKAYNGKAEQLFERIGQRLLRELNPHLQRMRTDAQRREFFQKRHREAFRKSPELAQLQADLRSKARVVDVALDLGMVRLRRAQSMRDPVNRKAELQAAERTFLAVRGAAGDSQQYQLFLGQVSYWLGKYDQGKEQFDKLLVSSKRSPQVLVMVGRTLREVGRVADARQLLIEAYNRATDTPTKHNAAALVAVLTDEASEKVKWYERSDPNTPQVRSALAQNRGTLAFERGEIPEAIKHYREAIRIYEEQPESAPTLNNCALVYTHLFQATGDVKDFETGVARMEKALELVPSNPILQQNVASHLVIHVFLDIARKHVDFSACGSINADELRFFYVDAKGRDAIYDRALNDPRTRRAESLIEKALVLSPKQLNLYREKLTIVGWRRDPAHTLQLLARVRRARPDMTALRTSMLAQLSGMSDAQQKQSAMAAVTELRKRLRALGDKPTITGAILTRRLIANATRAAQYGLELDPEPLLALARKHHEAVPSSGTRSAMRDALILSIGRDMMKQAGYAQVHNRCRRAFTHGDLLGCVNVTPSLAPLRKPMHAHPLWPELMAIEVDGERKFPDSPWLGTWCFLQHHEDWGPKLTAAMKASKRFVADHALADALAPGMPSILVSRVYAAKVLGKGLPEALKAYDAARARKMPLPPLR